MNMAKMAKGGIICAIIEETEELIKKPHTKVQAEILWGVAVPGHKLLKAGTARHLSMVPEYQTDGCLP
jgi:hypothetical protein